MVTLQEKQYNEYNNQVAKQEWLLQDSDPAPKQRPEQEAGNMTGKGIQQEEQQGVQKQVTGIHFYFY